MVFRTGPYDTFAVAAKLIAAHAEILSSGRLHTAAVRWLGMVASPPIPDKLRSLIQLHWGIKSLRPLQDEAMRAVLGGRDSLVVMPTGGGKSLC